MMKRYALVCFTLVFVLAASSAAAIRIPADRSLLTEVPYAPAAPGYSIFATESCTCLVLEEPRRLDSLTLTDSAGSAQYTFLPSGDDGTVYFCDALAAVPNAGPLLLQWSEQGGYASAALDLTGRASAKISLSFPDPEPDGSRDKTYRYDGRGELTGLAVGGVELAFDSQGRLSAYSYTADDGARVRYKGDNSLESIVYTQGASSYFYNPADGWQTYDSLTGRLTPCAAPSGVDAVHYPAFDLQTPPITAAPATTPRPSPSPGEQPMPSDGPASSKAPSTRGPDAPPPTPSPSPEPARRAVWYDRNTVCLAGLSLRELCPERTDKWYPVVPVDLTRQGVQTYDLVAGNLFIIGKATVTIEGDRVTVTYGLAKGEGYIKDECLRWFTGLEEITASFLEKPSGTVAFGETISIERDLKGRDTALLFIRNTASYRQPYDGEYYLPRYWPNLPWRAAERETMAELLRRLAK